MKCKKCGSSKISFISTTPIPSITNFSKFVIEYIEEKYKCNDCGECFAIQK